MGSPTTKDVLNWIGTVGPQSIIKREFARRAISLFFPRSGERVGNRKDREKSRSSPRVDEFVRRSEPIADNDLTSKSADARSQTENANNFVST